MVEAGEVLEVGLYSMGQARHQLRLEVLLLGQGAQVDLVGEPC